jgi:XTP/dITP diphosphohydrolase
MDRLMEIMRRLRARDGCPWDREQTHLSLRPYLLEEAAEAADALAYGTKQEFAAELGDVLLQIAFHSVIAEEEGTFTYSDVEEAIVSKLVRRHPHVFAGTVVQDSEDVRVNWLRIKEEERAGQPQPLPADSVPRGLPALKRAQELGKVLGWLPENHEPAGTATAAGTGQELAARVIDLALQASREGIDLELAVRDELEARAAAAPESGPSRAECEADEG